MRRLAPLLVLVGGHLLATPAGAVDRYVTMKVPPAAGPAKYDMNEAARILGLRLEHGREIDLPLYAFSTDLTKGRVARGARKLARLTPIEKPVVVDDRRTSHLDPLSAAPKRNSFLKSVVPFLKRISRGPAS